MCVGGGVGGGQGRSGIDMTDKGRNTQLNEHPMMETQLCSDFILLGLSFIFIHDSNKNPGDGYS